MNETFYAPPLLVIFCAMSAMSFIIASIGWLFSVGMTPDSTGHKTFNHAVWTAQVLNLTAILLFSSFVTIFDSMNGYGEFSITAEISILSIVLVLFILKCTKNKKSIIKGLWKSFKSMLLLLLFCLGGWGVTITLGWSLMTVLSALMGPDDLQEIMVIGPFLAGVTWNIPILWAFFYFKKRKQPVAALEGKQMQHFLWPVLLAYLILIMPLFIQHVANSEKWREMQNSKPIAKKI